MALKIVYFRHREQWHEEMSTFEDHSVRLNSPSTMSLFHPNYISNTLQHLIEIVLEVILPFQHTSLPKTTSTYIFSREVLKLNTRTLVAKQTNLVHRAFSVRNPCRVEFKKIPIFKCRAYNFDTNVTFLSLAMTVTSEIHKDTFDLL